MGKFLKSRWWVGVFDAFGSIAGGAFDLLNNQHSLEFDPNFSIKSNANADYRPLQTIVFTMQSERDKNSPTDCFLTLKYNGLLSVCSLHFVLSSFGMDWYTPGTLVRKCVHKQSYINYMNGSLHQILTNSGKPTFDIFSFITSGPTDKLCKLNDL